MKRHNLKVLPQYFKAQINGIKNFEMRRHDRDFEVGDEIKLNEISAKLCEAYKPTGRACIVRITYILASTYDAPFEGLELGYSILGTEMVYNSEPIEGNHG